MDYFWVGLGIGFVAGAFMFDFAWRMLRRAEQRLAFDDEFGPEYEAGLARIIEDVKPPDAQLVRLAEIGRKRGWKTR